jgi:hypothetical protein
VADRACGAVGNRRRSSLAATCARVAPTNSQESIVEIRSTKTVFESGDGLVVVQGKAVLAAGGYRRRAPADELPAWFDGMLVALLHVDVTLNFSSGQGMTSSGPLEIQAAKRLEMQDASPDILAWRRVQRKWRRSKLMWRPKTYVASKWRRRETGAGEGIRTLDPNLGKVVLYP